MSAKPGLIAEFRRIASSDLSKNTISTYIFWLKKFHAVTGKNAAAWTGRDITSFIHCMEQERYALKSRHQALCAIVYAFKKVLRVDPGNLDLPKIQRPKPTLKILPTPEEIARIFAGLRGQQRLMAWLIYGSGLRVNECCELRMKDIDFAEPSICIHAGKGGKNRKTVLPIRLVPLLRRQMEWRAALHAWDVENGNGLCELPGRIARKYKSASRDLAWQFVFPSQAVREGYRWHAVPESIQKAMRQAVRAAGILKRVTPHTLRHACATHMLKIPGNDIATVSQMLGHESLETTAIYVHADQAPGISPLDAPAVPRLPARQPLCLP